MVERRMFPKVKNTEKSDYTIVCTDAIRDDRISFNAKGILVYLLSECESPLQENEFKELIENCGLFTDLLDYRTALNVPIRSTDTIESGMRELEDAGYLKRSKGECWISSFRQVWPFS